MMKKTLKIDKGWLTNTRKVVSPHFDARPNPRDISLLIIHYISLPPEEFGGSYIDDFFQGKLDSNRHPYFAEISTLRVSAHCLINRAGEITQYVNFNDRAWHAGISCFEGREKCNDFAIGIELEGSNEQPFTTQQYVSLQRLTLEIMRAYPLITKERIVGHCDVSPGRKIDPGQYFDWATYLDQL
ncbi:N-acetyl-anhydromuranmyl-L-alanine amidase [Aggregatibacter aphrophilus]|jgi:1,6-anhydro-N-acetylmuramyl-L-alanine amidase ampD|uniref:1,6-anhydro-N-acetylmuramyl-L-alanine amidase AmpD n=1 Tax=Aggregatibacter aphrophilus TaxID=732 RepID=A0ABX9VWF0_AGGAP|nr:1,6-anhydro-N-acetylmuramyl-L-alanine amidase AmpD [Aggregatibacter aphrophilus]AKU64254.1 N-acetyl-anhydromuranmyl-L-alanine amidase [Aggregatibacter aphrophilus]RMW89175.1 1,6-anhydro-N-acetylmuramyl-L-alanine amidase AmpD [Aggregatibacter aphrophilus]